MNILSRLTQAVLHARTDLAYAKATVEALETASQNEDVTQTRALITCEFALDDAIEALRAEEAIQLTKESK